ncbi:MAG: TIGR00730 family Rossman fold protein [Chloroflexi bacterium]|nr:MAG: TIGR00730 family Rossman fold protein [Chloroflexota bacterium]
MQRFCVFCGSNDGSQPIYVEAARQLGTALAERGVGLVYGGGQVGLMGAVAHAALDAGGEVIGVMTEDLMRKEIGFRELPQLHVVETMHERKMKMAELADAFIVMPGGFGTMEEFFEMAAHGLLGYHDKALSFLNTGGYYDTLFAFFKHIADEQFIAASFIDLLIVDDSPTRLVERLINYQPPHFDRWEGQ